MEGAYYKTKESVEEYINLAKEVNGQNLIDDGIICLSFWKGEGSEFFKEMFVNYHNEKSLRDSFEDGFEILSLTSYKEFEEEDSILLIAKKNN